MKTRNLPICIAVILGVGVTTLHPAHSQDYQDRSRPHTEDTFDTDTGQTLLDSDGDTFPDLTETMGGTDLLNPEDYPGVSDGKGAEVVQTDSLATVESAGFPSSNCRSGYYSPPNAPRLCINWNAQPSMRYDQAAVHCRDRSGRVATYEDLFYLYLRSPDDQWYNPNGRWIGNMHDDDDVFRGNKSITFDNDPDMWNFEGSSNKSDRRQFWCAHDRF